MKTTININDELLNSAMKAINARSKTEAVEKGLKALINAVEKEKLVNLFGKEIQIKDVKRRRFK